MKKCTIFWKNQRNTDVIKILFLLKYLQKALIYSLFTEYLQTFLMSKTSLHYNMYFLKYWGVDGGLRHHMGSSVKNTQWLIGLKTPNTEVITDYTASGKNLLHTW